MPLVTLFDFIILMLINYVKQWYIHVLCVVKLEFSTLKFVKELCEASHKIVYMNNK